MSNDGNRNESIDSVEDVVENLKDAAEKVVDTVSDAAEDVVEAVTDTIEDVVETVEEGNVVSKIMGFKESNPKGFFGAIGGLLLVILFMLFNGGSNNPIPSPRTVNLSIGNAYTLKGVNTLDATATIRLVAVPGSMAAYDESEEDGSKGTCKHMPQGTKVKLLQIENAFGGAKFVELEILDSGECTGRKGWTTANNLN
jgi:hypothetical protein